MKTVKILTLFLLSALNSFSQLEEGVAIQNPHPGSGNPEIDRVISIVNTVEQNHHLIGQINTDSLATLPFGIIKQIGAVRYVIAVDSMVFKPQGAYFSAYAAIDLPGTMKKLAFRGSNIKFNPSGVIGGEQAKLYLASDHLISINSTVSLKLSANAQNWVEWDCNGFKAINLTGHFIFKKATLIPDPQQTTDTVVTASFQIYTQNIHDFIAAVNITPFKIKDLNDWSFKVTNAVVDMSELSNVSTMVFPQGYQNPNLVTPQMWTGFSLQSLKVILPKEISRANQRTEVSVNNLLIDNMGITGLFQVNNVFNDKEGNMSGWNFSLDEIGIGFTCNQLSSGHIKGKITMPAIDSSESFQYNASLNYNISTKETDYTFAVNPTSALSFKLFKANVFLNNNSTISVQKHLGVFKPTAILNGYMSFNMEKLNCNTGKLSFQNLTLITEAPYITNGVFSLHTINGSQPRTHNYPVSINDITLGFNQGAPVLGFSIFLNLSDDASNALTIGTSVLLKGKIDQISGSAHGTTSSHWSFDKATIDAVAINIQTAPFTLNGNLIFKDDDPVYGKGFFGSLSVGIPKIMPAPANLNVAFGCKEEYRYYYLDAKIPTAFNLGSLPVKITQLSGGIYYHMVPNKTTEVDLVALNQSMPNSGNALTYIPTQSVSLGFKAGVKYEFSANQLPYNGDLFLDVNFTSAGGLGTVALTGDVYSMVSVAQRNNAPVKGRMVMVYDAQNRIFDALAQVNINAYQAITGSGYFKIHIDPEIWYLCVGKPSAPNMLNYLNLVSSPSYFMVGNTLEAPMPPPGPIASNPAFSSVLGNRDNNQLLNATGFCVGAKVSSHLSRSFGMSFFNVSGDFDFDMGCDMMMINYGENSTCQGTQTKVGINGWLANGNMYLNLNGGVNISGNFKFPADCPTRTEICVWGKCAGVDVPCIVNSSFSQNVCSTQISAVVSAKFPKPIHFAGDLTCHYNIFDRLTGDFNYSFDYGTDCTPVN